MTLSTVILPDQYDGDDSTASFPVTFKFWDSDELLLILTDSAGAETTWVEGTQYTVGGGAGSTGNITVSTSPTDYTPATGETLTIHSNMDYSQPTNVPAGGPLASAAIEQQFDQSARQTQQLDERLGRALVFPQGDDTALDAEIPNSTDRASARLGFDAAGEPIAVTSDLSGVATTAYIDTLLDDGDAVTARGTLIAAGLPDENTFLESQIWFKGSDLGDGDITGDKLTVGAGNEFDVAGTEKIDEITTVGVGFLLLLHWDSARILEHSAVNLILPGGEDIVTVAGEMSLLQEYATGDFRMIHHFPSIPVRLQKSVDLSQKTTFSDDFIGTISTPISSTGGSGADTEAATISAGVGGRVTMKSDIDLAVDTHAAVCSTLTLDVLDWRADQGGLILETRLQIDDVSEAVIFVGFTDTISTTVELPIYKTTGADTIDSDAANACGICYDVDGTTDEWFHGGVKAGTDTSAVHSGSAPSDNTYVTLRVEVSAAGAVEGFVDSVSIGTAKVSAVTATTPLTPAIVIGNRTANQVIVTVDYLHVQADR